MHTPITQSHAALPSIHPRFCDFSFAAPGVYVYILFCSLSGTKGTEYSATASSSLSDGTLTKVAAVIAASAHPLESVFASCQSSLVHLVPERSGLGNVSEPLLIDLAMLSHSAVACRSCGLCTLTDRLPYWRGCQRGPLGIVYDVFQEQ